MHIKVDGCGRCDFLKHVRFMKRHNNKLCGYACKRSLNKDTGMYGIVMNINDLDEVHCDCPLRTKMFVVLLDDTK